MQTSQKIFTVNQLVDYFSKKIPESDTLDAICILYKLPCAITRKNPIFNKDIVFINPINIKLLAHTDEVEDGQSPPALAIARRAYGERVDMENFKEEFDEDVGIKYSLRKGMKLDNGQPLNILKINAKKQYFKGEYVYYDYINKGYNASNSEDKFIKDLIAAHENDELFKFRPKPKNELDYLEEV